MTQIIGSNGIRVKAKTIVVDNIIFMSRSVVDVAITNFFTENNTDNSLYIEQIYSIQNSLTDSVTVGKVNNLSLIHI